MVTRCYGFRVEELPPKKSGAISMWGNLSEIPRLIHLRRAALAELGENAVLQRDIRLWIVVHIGPRNTRQIGDLDTFVAGVCDGLMAADGNATLGDQWGEEENARIHPSRPIAINDDYQVVSICASKVVGDPKPFYTVGLEGDDGLYPSRMKATANHGSIDRLLPLTYRRFAIFVNGEQALASSKASLSFTTE